MRRWRERKEGRKGEGEKRWGGRHDFWGGRPWERDGKREGKKERGGPPNVWSALTPMLLQTTAVYSIFARIWRTTSVYVRSYPLSRSSCACTTTRVVRVRLKSCEHWSTDASVTLSWISRYRKLLHCCYMTLTAFAEISRMLKINLSNRSTGIQHTLSPENEISVWLVLRTRYSG